jgi:4-hydroxy-L-threonine phosphate dehydrogenase PdxA
VNSKPIIITTGDFKSIFFEIFFKSIKKNIQSPIILICNLKDYLKQAKKNNFKKKIYLISQKNLNRKFYYSKKFLNIINIDLDNLLNQKSLINIEKFYIQESFKVAFKLIKKGLTNKFINGPINKTKFLNKKNLGITEYISKQFNVKNYAMLIFNKNLSVSPITTHTPIRIVYKKIKKKIIEKQIELIDDFYLKLFKIRPKIAVTGLNPHCETILNIDEDKKEVLPAILKMKKKKINVDGPLSADTIFLQNNRKKYNVIIGMYHDQVLGPFKSLFEYNAINITIGLPFFRVSPDHGPNTEMIGKNKSNPQSLSNAIFFLDKI